MRPTPAPTGTSDPSAAPYGDEPTTILNRLRDPLQRRGAQGARPVESPQATRGDRSQVPEGGLEHVQAAAERLRARVEANPATSTTGQQHPLIRAIERVITVADRDSHRTETDRARPVTSQDSPVQAVDLTHATEIVKAAAERHTQRVAAAASSPTARADAEEIVRAAAERFKRRMGIDGPSEKPAQPGETLAATANISVSVLAHVSAPSRIKDLSESPEKAAIAVARSAISAAVPSAAPVIGAAAKAVEKEVDRSQEPVHLP